ncbi:MAG: Rpn family recombination-promoting nuclease/putative transposase [Clostridiales Family XIII bacterium]|nr:Rpn family recombination-promoting nuclease/putative transposase [Clostridiales Family XIII bacterium]
MPISRISEKRERFDVNCRTEDGRQIDVEEIKMASELLMSISQDEKERAHYRSRKMFLMDMEHAMAVARDEGIEKGIEQGIEEGIEQGKIEVARNAFAIGLSVDQIEKLTGLSRAELESLREFRERRALSGVGAE